MARVTIEDCLENVENRFKLVLLAGTRARQLSHGATEFLPRGKIKIPFLLCVKSPQVMLPLKTFRFFTVLAKHTTTIPCSKYFIICRI